MSRLCIIVLGVLLSEGRSVELAPGWPVYLGDSTVVMSQTVPGFKAKIHRLTSSDTLAERSPQIEVDGQGEVWMQWQVVTDSSQVQIHLAKLLENGLSSTPNLAVPAVESWPFVDNEPVIIPWESGEGPLLLQFGTSGAWRRVVGGGGCCYFDLRLIALSKAGSSLVVLWDAHYAFPGPTGGYGSAPVMATIVRPDGTAKTWWASLMGLTYGDSFFGGRDIYYTNYSTALSIGSDGPNRVFVLSLEDSELDRTESDDLSGTSWPFWYIADPVIQVVGLETRFLGDLPSLGRIGTKRPGVEKWTLGYDRREYKEEHWWPNPITAAITANHKAVGFALWREGDLNLWVLSDSSWYGPYPIASDVEKGVPAIAVDTWGRYWIAFTRDRDLYATTVTPEELGLGLRTSLSGLEQGGPTPPSTLLAPARPNPFNASTLISYSVGSPGHVSLVICNTLGQVVDTLVDRVQPAGSNSVSWDPAAGVSSGIYLARLVTPNARETRKLMLLR